MDNVAERQARELSDRRRMAFAEAQKSGTNIYWFRRLKWGAPRAPGRAAAKPGFGIVELLLCIVIVASLAFAAVTIWFH